MHDQKDLLLKLAEGGNQQQNLLDCRVKSYAADVAITAVRFTQNQDPLWKLPDKLNPIIRPLMECIKVQSLIAFFAISLVVLLLLLDGFEYPL